MNCLGDESCVDTGLHHIMLSIRPQATHPHTHILSPIGPEQTIICIVRLAGTMATLIISSCTCKVPKHTHTTNFPIIRSVQCKLHSAN